MRTYSLSVSVYFGKEGKMTGLEEASASGKPVGSLSVVVVKRSDHWELTGNALAVEMDDFGAPDTLADIDTRLAAELGTIGAVAKSDPCFDDYKAGDDVSLAYVLNHGGLALAYGDAIKDTFRVRTGRVSLEAATKVNTEAVIWASTSNPEAWSAFQSSKDMAALVAAYRGR